jgi:UDP-glucose 4-epimerase
VRALICPSIRACKMNGSAGKDSGLNPHRRDAGKLEEWFASRKGKVHSVLHMAALKSVGESVSKPLEYYQNNIVGTINLLKAMPASGCKRIVFSSSATVYGNPEKVCDLAKCTHDHKR